MGLSMLLSLPRDGHNILTEKCFCLLYGPFYIIYRILDRFGGYLSKDFRDSPLDLSGQITGTNCYNIPNTLNAQLPVGSDVIG